MTTAEKTLCPRCKEDLSSYLQMKPDLGFCLFCQFPLMPVAGKYQLLEVLGEGGFGTVYRAKHLSMHRDAERVIKVMKPEVMEQPGMQERFLREVQTTSALSQRNPHIVRVFDDFGEIPRLGYFYVMEFLKGVPLSDYVSDREALPPISWCLDVFAQLCDAMQAAHEENIVHRDLKPDNIFLIHHRRRDNFVKVLDFGIAKPLDNATSTGGHKTQGLLGTPFYVAPEQISNAANLDHRADIYAMGIILHEMLTGMIPLIDPNKMEGMSLLQLISMRMMSHEIPSLRSIRPDRHIPEGLDLAVQKALEHNPANRFSSVEEFWETLEPYQGEQEQFVLSKPPSVAGVESRPKKSSFALDRTGEMDLNSPRSTPDIRVSQEIRERRFSASAGPLPTATEADVESIDPDQMVLSAPSPSTPRAQTAALSSPSSRVGGDFARPASSVSSISSLRASSASSVSATPSSSSVRFGAKASRDSVQMTFDEDDLGARRSKAPLFGALFGGIVLLLGLAYGMGLFTGAPAKKDEKVTVSLADAGGGARAPFPDMMVDVPEAKPEPRVVVPEKAPPEPAPRRVEPAPRPVVRKKRRRRRGRVRRRTPIERRVEPIRVRPPVVRKVEPCPGAIFMGVWPRSLKEIVLSGNKKAVRSADRKGFCLPLGTKRAALSHPGFMECQFSIPQRAKFRVRLREEKPGEIADEGYCLVR
ncbi:MAG: serine/threonine protein kinase [Myxococcales bacterium]|nr:serine/threonine protein kinase [Myxococcales bacterium]